MRNGRAKKLREDLRAVRQEILILIEEHEARFPIEEKKEEMKEETAPAHLETIARLMLEELGGGEFRIMLKGEQNCRERARELRIEEEKRLWALPLYRNPQ